MCSSFTGNWCCSSISSIFFFRVKFTFLFSVRANCFTVGDFVWSMFCNCRKFFETFKWPHLIPSNVDEKDRTTISPSASTNEFLTVSPKTVPLSFSWPFARSKRQDTSLNNNLNQRSLCPWNYTLDHDANRIPQDLYNANCLSSTYMSYTCERVKTSMLVLKRLPGEAWTTSNVVIATSCVVAKSPGTNSPSGAVGSTS